MNTSCNACNWKASGETEEVRALCFYGDYHELRSVSWGPKDAFGHTVNDKVLHDALY